MQKIGTKKEMVRNISKYCKLINSLWILKSTIKMYTISVSGIVRGCKRFLGGSFW